MPYPGRVCRPITCACEPFEPGTGLLRHADEELKALGKQLDNNETLRKEKSPEWNPFITKASGPTEEGAQLEIRIEPPNSSVMNFKPTVTKIKEEREFRWLGRLWIPGIFDGEHSFEIESMSEQKIRFIQREKFNGLLVPILWKSLNKNTRHGFEKMNAALKKPAEQKMKSF